jgi:hypothetical protein
MIKLSIAIIVLFFFNLSADANDTLFLPIKNGIVKYDKFDSSFLSYPNGIKIYAINDFRVRSCSDGRVTSASKLSNGEFLVVIMGSDSLFYSYGSLDIACVKKGQLIRRGDEIGTLTKANPEERFIIFSVMKRNKFLKAEKFLIKSSP